MHIIRRTIVDAMFLLKEHNVKMATVEEGTFSILANKVMFVNKVRLEAYCC